MKTYFALKLLVLVVLIIVLFLGGTYLVLLPRLENEIVDRNKETIRATTQIALSHIHHAASHVDTGTLRLEEAKAQALKDIYSYRYGDHGKSYFWVSTMNGTMLLHPYRADLVHVENHLLNDSHASELLRRFATIVRKDGRGYTSYLWQWQDDPTRVIEKISYVEGFSEWEWIVGTGFYIADIEEGLATMTRNVFQILIIVLSCIVLLLMVIVYKAIVANNSHQAATARLQQSERRFRDLADLLPEGIFECDLDLRITYANNRASEMIGYDESDLKRGISCSQLFTPESQEQVQEVLRRKILGDFTGPNEYTVIRKDGSFFSALLHSAYIMKDDEPQGLRGIVVDISRQKEIERQLVYHRDNLERNVAERTRELEQALREVKLLTGLIPICAKCKKIKNDQGYWSQVETYIEQHSDACFSHSICPVCAENLYGKEKWFTQMKGDAAGQRKQSGQDLRSNDP